MKPLKVWWVVAWNDFYPEKALENVKGMFFSEAEAQAFIARDDHEESYDQAKIIDISEMIGYN